MEEKTELKTIEVNFRCPKCEKGYLKHTGMVLTSYPAQYPHVCDNKECDYKETFRGLKYPHIEYERIVLNKAKTREELVAEYNFTVLCARSTLYPGVAIEDLPMMTVEKMFPEKKE